MIFITFSARQMSVVSANIRGGADASGCVGATGTRCSAIGIASMVGSDVKRCYMMYVR